MYQTSACHWFSLPVSTFLLSSRSTIERKKLFVLFPFLSFEAPFDSAFIPCDTCQATRIVFSCLVELVDLDDDQYFAERVVIFGVAQFEEWEEEEVEEKDYVKDCMYVVATEQRVDANVFASAQFNM